MPDAHGVECRLACGDHERRDLGSDAVTLTATDARHPPLDTSVSVVSVVTHALLSVRAVDHVNRERLRRDATRASGAHDK